MAAYAGQLQTIFRDDGVSPRVGKLLGMLLFSFLYQHRLTISQPSTNAPPWLRYPSV